jgi:hypothetical protein
MIEDEKKARQRPSQARGRPKLDVVRLDFALARKALDQLDALAGALNISRAAVISQAISRWYHNEPLVAMAEKEKSNGSGDA